MREGAKDAIRICEVFIQIICNAAHPPFVSVWNGNVAMSRVQRQQYSESFKLSVSQDAPFPLWATRRDWNLIGRPYVTTVICLHQSRLNDSHDATEIRTLRRDFCFTQHNA